MNKYNEKIHNDQLRWIGVDLDNCLAIDIWPEPGIGPIMPGAKETLDKIQAQGYKLVLFTSRPYADYNNIEKWCEDNQLPIRRIFCGKPFLRWMIDDRNIEFKGSWDEIVNKIS